MEKDDSGGKGRIVLATVKGDVHDIGKNLVDIILTNNGYEVHNIGIKVGIAEMIEKAVEIKADAIGMSGLLVKSTLIMRDNLEELNQPRAVRHPGAARRRRAHPHLRRARPARGLRGPAVLRQGRLRGPARHGPARRDQAGTGDDDPDWGRVPSESTGARSRRRTQRRRRRTGGRAARSLTRGRDRQPGLHARRSSARRSSRASRIDDIAAYINETALFRNQWQFRPEKQADGPTRPTTSSRTASARSCARSWPRPRPTTCSCPRSSTATSPANSDGNDLVIWKDETAPPSGCASRYPAPAEGAVPLHRRLLPPGSPRRGRLRRLPHRHHGRARLRGDQGPVRRRTSTRSTCWCTASASRWPRRWPSTGTTASARSGASSTRTGRSLAGLFRQQYRGGRYSWGYPACPDLEDNEKVAELLDAGAPRHRGQRGDRLPVPARADDLRHHLPPPQGQVLRRPLIETDRVGSGTPDRWPRTSRPKLRAVAA